MSVSVGCWLPGSEKEKMELEKCRQHTPPIFKSFLARVPSGVPQVVPTFPSEILNKNYHKVYARRTEENRKTPKRYKKTQIINIFYAFPTNKFLAT